MTVAAAPRKILFPSISGSTGPFSFSFRTLIRSGVPQIRVTKYSALGVPTDLNYPADYSFSTTTSGISGGQIVLSVMGAASESLVISGLTPKDQPIKYANQGRFFPEVHEVSYDQGIMVAQEQQQDIDRSLKIPLADTINAELPIAALRLGKTLVFDEVTGAPTVSAFSFTSQLAQLSAQVALGQDWATKTNGIVAATDYSSKAYAIGGTGITGSIGAAKEWAISASKPDGVNESAKTYASTASTQATNATAARVAAEAARDATLAAFDSFDDRYLGVKSADPTLDNDGNALVAGALYFNSVSGAMLVYTGSAWVAAYVSGSGYLAAANNLSDLGSAATARTNLGLGSLATLSSVATANITNSNVTYAKIQNITATQRILGRNTAGAGVTEEVTATQVLDWLGATRGQILYRGASAWTVLAPGTAGQVLVTNGAGADPSWGAGIPTGAVMPCALSTEPSGWLFCAGQAVSRATYSALFSAIGTTYGVGDGSTTFNLPDLRGRAVFGRDDMNASAANRITAGGSGITGTSLGASGGVEVHTLTTAQLPVTTPAGTVGSHQHFISNNTDGSSSGTSTISSSNFMNRSNTNVNNKHYITGDATAAVSGLTSATAPSFTGTSFGSGSAHQTTPPALILNYIIKT